MPSVLQEPSRLVPCARLESNVTSDRPLVSERFPRASKYHSEWIKSSVSGGANSQWMTEWLTGALDLRPGMRVLDLGCGRASSSIFLRREFGVQVEGEGSVV
jgi:cyclopropane fatty-acyl-phospholipid synthase-like methyltransferase